MPKIHPAAILSILKVLGKGKMPRKRKILTTCNFCGKNTPGTYAKISFPGGALRYCISCFPLMIPTLEFICPEGLWSSVPEMLQYDEENRKPREWSMMWTRIK